MPRDPRFDVLFEPVQIGPLTARNRFFQVPHCSGMGHLLPRSDAAMRSMKAEGGWAVVCTEQCSFHPHAEAAPYPETKLWDRTMSSACGIGPIRSTPTAHWPAPRS